MARPARVLAALFVAGTAFCVPHAPRAAPRRSPLAERRGSPDARPESWGSSAFVASTLGLVAVAAAVARRAGDVPPTLSMVDFLHMLRRGQDWVEVCVKCLQAASNSVGLNEMVVWLELLTSPPVLQWLGVGLGVQTALLLNTCKGLRDQVNTRLPQWEAAWNRQVASRKFRRIEFIARVAATQAWSQRVDEIQQIKDLANDVLRKLQRDTCGTPGLVPTASTQSYFSTIVEAAQVAACNPDEQVPEAWRILRTAVALQKCSRSARDDRMLDVMEDFAGFSYKTAFFFPGQGAQTVGMCKELTDEVPKAKEMFETASDIIGYDLLDRCVNGPKEELDKTAVSQPAIFVASMAAVEKLRLEDPAAIDEATVAMGLSLGEYSALSFAGALRLTSMRRKKKHLVVSHWPARAMLMWFFCGLLPLTVLQIAAEANVPVPQPVPVAQPTETEGEEEEDLRLSPTSEMTKPDLWYIFLQADANDDQKLSKPELFNFAAHYKEEIERATYSKVDPNADLDKDGALSKEELEKYMSTWEIEEFPQELERVRNLEREKFKLADADGDGKLQGEELVAMYGHGIDEKVLEAEAKSALSVKDMDKDGKLSLKEFWHDYLRPDDDHDHDEDPRDRNVTFAALDSNEDGSVDLQELMIWESGLFFLEEAIDGILHFADRDEDGEAGFQELVDAWPEIEEVGVQLPLRGIFARALGEHEGAHDSEL
ncbi:Mcat [Symbiodinium microadriaticum]|nr:Mcat [Symbiodinium microadriaticum]